MTERCEHKINKGDFNYPDYRDCGSAMGVKVHKGKNRCGRHIRGYERAMRNS